MEKVLVTGGAGFIGSHIVDELVSKDYNVIVVDNLFEGRMENLAQSKNKIKFVKGDIRDRELMEKTCKGITHILHQAARRSVPASFKDPLEYNDVNIKGTLTLLESARKNDVGSFVFASSSSVYGEVKESDLPQKETLRTNPMSPYALTKLAGEHYLKVYHSLYGLKTVSLRYFNVFGPRQDPNSQYSAVIPLFVKALMQKKQPVIYGDGKQSRDFTFVKNVADGNILAMNARKEAGGEIFNLANGISVSVNDLLEKIKKLLGGEALNIKPKYADKRPGDIIHTMADSSKARKILGYKEEVSFDDGLKITVDRFRKGVSNA